MPLGEKRIFIVDDDKSVRRALKLLMLAYGFSADTFSSSEEFFGAVPNSAPGCLILDIHLPGLNGWDAHQRLIKTGSNRPVIIITGDRSSGLNERALKAGAVGLLQKPFHDKELVDLLNRQCFN